MKANDPKIWAILSGLLVISAVPTGSSIAGDGVLRSLYAVNQSRNERGSISVYDIDAGHRLIKTIQTVPNVADVKGVAASAVTGRLYVAYQDLSGTGMIYCMNIYDDTIVWNRAISPGIKVRPSRSIASAAALLIGRSDTSRMCFPSMRTW